MRCMHACFGYMDGWSMIGSFVVGLRDQAGKQQTLPWMSQLTLDELAVPTVSPGEGEPEDGLEVAPASHAMEADVMVAAFFDNGLLCENPCQLEAIAQAQAAGYGNGLSDDEWETEFTAYEGCFKCTQVQSALDDAVVAIRSEGFPEFHPRHFNKILVSRTRHKTLVQFDLKPALMNPRFAALAKERYILSIRYIKKGIFYDVNVQWTADAGSDGDELGGNVQPGVETDRETGKYTRLYKLLPMEHPEVLSMIERVYTHFEVDVEHDGPLEQVVVHDFGEFYWVCIGASNTGVALYITTSDPSECLEERPDLLKGVDGPGCGKEDEGLGPEYYLERAREFDGVLLAW